jgi:phage repressor protein C with HTH and peptisase S24 domain
MSSVKDTKNEVLLNFSYIYPFLKNKLNLKTQEELAEKLGIRPSAVTNAKAKGIMPPKWISSLALQKLITWEEFTELMQKKEEPPGMDKAPKPVPIAEARPMEAPVTTDGIISQISIPYGTGATKARRYKVMLELLQRWVDETFPVEQRHHIFAWIVDEDNMEPTITRKSLVLVDGADHNLQAKGIFAFNSNGHMTLLRAYPHGDGVNIDLVNDNRNYPPTHLPEKNLTDGPGIRVAGRVIFRGCRV